MQRRWFAVLSVLIVVCFGASARAEDDGFARWAESFKAQAKAEGISAPVIEEAFTGLTENEEVITLDRKQPENKITLNRYLKNTISQRRIDLGRQMMVEYKDVLDEIGRRYGVQPKYIVALWAIESDFGNNKGNFSVVQSLATLAYEGRRAEFFSKELIAALRILDAENMTSQDLSGSWAGAMGDCQFMPSTFLRYAVDGNKDGRRDIWNTQADIFASIANYLHSLGWNRQAGWGRAVNVPEDFALSEADIKQGNPASHWRARGLTYKNGHKIHATNATFYAIYPGTEDEGVYLVTDNFKALLQWNRSRYFATAVGTLADAIGE